MWLTVLIYLAALVLVACLIGLAWRNRQAIAAECGDDPETELDLHDGSQWPMYENGMRRIK